VVTVLNQNWAQLLFLIINMKYYLLANKNIVCLGKISGDFCLYHTTENIDEIIKNNLNETWAVHIFMRLCLVRNTIKRLKNGEKSRNGHLNISKLSIKRI
jgi:hypothetical protein